jgi:hypothetical protein
VQRTREDTVISPLRFPLPRSLRGRSSPKHAQLGHSDRRTSVDVGSLFAVVAKMKSWEPAILVGTLAVWFFALGVSWQMYRISNDLQWLRNFGLISCMLSAYVFLSLRSVTDRLRDLLSGSKWPSLASWYTSTAVALLMVTTVVSCVGFFEIAHDYHARLFLGRDQLLILRALARREAGEELLSKS